MSKYVTGTALGDLDMVLHDTSQYLLKALGSEGEVYAIHPPWQTPDDGLVPSSRPTELLRRAKMLKDLAIMTAGLEPLEWGVG